MIRKVEPKTHSQIKAMVHGRYNDMELKPTEDALQAFRQKPVYGNVQGEVPGIGFLKKPVVRLS